MKKPVISVKKEFPEFGSLLVNGAHIWRFDSMTQAKLAASNLTKALGLKPLPVPEKDQQ